MKPYQRHLFVCTGRPDWPARIEQGDGYLQILAEAIAACQGEMPFKAKLTACDEPTRGPGYDILVFPEAIRYLNVTEADFSTLVEDHLIGNRLSPHLRREPLPGRHVFVCVHQARDPRCGECGPAVAQQFRQTLAARGLADSVFVHQTSHVGQHALAGNVLIYPGGDWYGLVTPAVVHRLVEEHLLQGQIVATHWRGRLGLSPEQQRALAGLPALRPDSDEKGL